MSIPPAARSARFPARASIPLPSSSAILLAGDTNLDLTVNTADFNTLAANFNQSGKQWFQGDFNYDGIVNAEDFAMLAANYGSAWLPSLARRAGNTPLVPEPLFGLCVPPLLLFLRERRSRSTT